jgi:hypothetical protein
MANRPIAEKEIALARKLAKRKKGTTRAELADKIDGTLARAALVFARAKIRGKPRGGLGGKGNTCLIYRAL